MGSTQFGKFHDFCRDSTLPICNIFPGFSYKDPSNFNPQCYLTGISLNSGGTRHLGNLGVILLCGVAILISAYLLWRSERKQAAVGRREMQLFLLGYVIIEICEIFTVGKIPGLSEHVRIGFTAVHLGMIVATLWILMLNAAVGYQILDDGTPLSVGLMVGSAIALFIGTGYITLDTGLNWTGYFEANRISADNKSTALYVLYQLVPLIFLFLFFALETVLVIRILGEKKPMMYLVAAALLFAIGQIFNYVVSIHICNGTNGKIDGSLFQTLFTLLSVVTIWIFWSSITEDDWPSPVNNTYS
ncbi:related to export control protein CHS7 [Rhynchosporium agropyri]|uniref:Related to export control protein CHS7 n=3 Tax=Rhynchosporium TaxID=38037 RepID=A0A1E1MID4_RHYSE|nr:related to export control protein CHS7 [Rhynchosporium agropyri]CZT09370.1 related to export control protein CHS7 [Rhynchosporium commune]CZT48869.1 related to export control protein CHS7 [Rhynchosporium secalis]